MRILICGIIESSKQYVEEFEKFSRSEVAAQHDNNRMQTFIYMNTCKDKPAFYEGHFQRRTDAGALSLKRNWRNMHCISTGTAYLFLITRSLSLYFGSGDYETCIDYLQKIINGQVDLRNDLQCYARLLHLMAHYELGNYEIMEYLTKSVYRFMAKMENLTVIEEEMFRFLAKYIFICLHEN